MLQQYLIPQTLEKNRSFEYPKSYTVNTKFILNSNPNPNSDSKISHNP